jgi:hypothetical protein
LRISKGSGGSGKATEIENAILAGTREGYGLIKIDNGSPVICVTTAEQEDAELMKFRRAKEKRAQQEQDRKRQKEEEEAQIKRRDQADAERKEVQESKLRAEHGSQTRARA